MNLVAPLILAESRYHWWVRVTPDGHQLFSTRSVLPNGTLNVRIGAHFPLAEVADAQRALEGRVTTGKVILDIG